MCYYLFVASPLTLSEIRAMLPPGLTADPLAAPDRQTLRALHRAAQTGVRLLVGSCSCDLVVGARPGTREEESHLRRRYFAAGLTRPAVIAALEAHRRGAREGMEPANGWRAALVAFVAEHARNAGPTLFLLHFGPEPLHQRPPAGPPTRLTLAQVEAKPDGWLVEDRPTVVAR